MEDVHRVKRQCSLLKLLPPLGLTESHPIGSDLRETQHDTIWQEEAARINTGTPLSFCQCFLPIVQTDLEAKGHGQPPDTEDRWVMMRAGLHRETGDIQNLEAEAKTTQDLIMEQAVTKRDNSGEFNKGTICRIYIKTIYKY